MSLTGGFGVRLRHFRSESTSCTIIRVRLAKRNPTSPHLLKSVMVWSFDGNIRSPTVSYLLDSTCQGTIKSETLIFGQRSIFVILSLAAHLCNSNKPVMSQIGPCSLELITFECRS